MGKTGATVLGVAGLALTAWNPGLFGGYMAAMGLGGLTVPGAYLGMAMMVGGGIWASYEQRKALRQAMTDAEAAARAIKGNTKSSQVSIPIAYGKTRIGGNIIYQATGNTCDHKPNSMLNTIYGVCEGPIEAFEGMWCDDTKVWEVQSGDTNINSGFLKGTGRYYKMFTAIRAKEPHTTVNAVDFRLGCNSQAYFVQINSICGGNDTGAGWDMDGNKVQFLDPDFNDSYPLTACVFTKFNMPNDYDPPYQGIPVCSWEIRGKRVRNINDLNTLHWTDNPAHILFDVMTNKQYGWSIPSSKIDLASFQSVGSFCAGSGSGDFSTSMQFPYGEIAPYLHTTVASQLQGSSLTYTWNPTMYAQLDVAGPNININEYDPSLYARAPMTAGSLSITVTASMNMYGKAGFITYGLYGDGSSNLRFCGYKELGMEGKTLLNGTLVTSNQSEFMGYQTGYQGGDISSGTIVGAVDYSTGSMSWSAASIQGMFSGQEYDSNAWYGSSNQYVDPMAQWYYGYGAKSNIGKKYIYPGSLHITALTSYGTENLSEVASGSGVFGSDVTYGGKYAGGGAVNYETGDVAWYTKGEPASLANVLFLFVYHVNGGYSFNGIISEASPAVDVVRDILQHFRGYLIYNQGVYQLKVDTVDTPVYAFDEDNIKAGSFVITQTPISERPNRVRAKYTDATENYSQKDVIYEPENPIVSLDDYVIEHIISISKCVYKDQAYRMAQTLGRQAQLGNTCSFVTGQDGSYVDIGNVITVTWPPASWIDKEFRVVEIEEKPDEEFSLSCVEYDATVYADEYTG